MQQSLVIEAIDLGDIDTLEEDIVPCSGCGCHCTTVILSPGPGSSGGGGGGGTVIV